MLIPSLLVESYHHTASLSRRVNANSQLLGRKPLEVNKLIKKGEC